MILEYEYLSSILVNNLLCHVVTIEEGTHLKLLAKPLDNLLLHRHALYGTSLTLYHH